MSSKKGNNKAEAAKANADGSTASDKDGNGSQTIELKREIGLISGINIIIGCIIGSGIFLTPTGVLKHCEGSIGFSLIAWSLGGIVSMVGALCYAELGTTITESGGDYAYIKIAFGNLAGFLQLWINVMIIRPTAQAVVSLIFARYALKLAYISCDVPLWPSRLLAACCLRKVENILPENTFDFSEKLPTVGGTAMALYNSLFAYAGWNFLNFVTEEMKEPHKNLPRAIYLSLPIVTIVYVLANLAYFIVLSPYEISTTEAVAVSFAEKYYGVFAFVMPLAVSMSCFGAVNGLLFTSGRIFFVGAREKQLPAFLSYISVKRKTPMPAMVFTCLLSLLMLLSDSIWTLVDYISFAQWFSVGASILAMLYLRRKHPEWPRPIRFHWIVPVTFLLFCFYLLVVPLYTEPKGTGLCLLMVLSGIPVYFVCVAWKSKPAAFERQQERFTRLVQKFMLVAPSDTHES
uniref:AA_permease domain-containing protein n=1 Tax=Macrostomum lignano TaxID=282301 RepID=A0A1I8GGW6_9PLAT